MHVALASSRKEDPHTDPLDSTVKASEEEPLSTRAAQLAAQVVASPLFYLVAGLVAIKLVSETGEQGVSILVFAALPVTLLTALSKSELGQVCGEDLSCHETVTLCNGVLLRDK